ncbi:MULTISPECIES: hypothetical protein [unclassified Microbacterium]|uniref:hypothetical protein n=1 Tax=unclassified Microbacterium TaxID=2609290 RepID=UPI00386B2B38
MSDDDDDFTTDFNAPEVRAAKDAVARAINDYLHVLRPDDAPYVVAWAVAAEWTNTDLELTGRAGRDIIMPNEQTISASAGLGSYLTGRFV